MYSSADRVDLHLHSYCSDGSDAPARVVERAAEMGLAAIALTDHDTVAGCAEAAQAAKDHGIGFLHGVEVSSHFEGHEVHIVALGIDIESTALLECLHAQRANRRLRSERILANLRSESIEIEFEHDLENDTGDALGRLHIAQALYQQGHVPTVQAAFDTLIGRGKPAFAPPIYPTSADAVRVIHEAGGLAFIAHPALTKGLKRLVKELLKLPFDGIEAWHSKHNPAQTAHYIELAKERNLLLTGGSDCHGTVKGHRVEMGRVPVPVECYERICAVLAARGSA